MGAIDFFIPGYSMFNDAFDLDGSRAAQAQFDSQLALQQQAQNYNSLEAEKARQFTKEMDDTSVQRRVEDIKAAGLNPWLAISGGGLANGAPSGSSAQSSSGSASMANNKLAQAAGVIALALRIFLAKH